MWTHRTAELASAQLTIASIVFNNIGSHYEKVRVSFVLRVEQSETSFSGLFAIRAFTCSGASVSIELLILLEWELASG